MLIAGLVCLWFFGPRDKVDLFWNTSTVRVLPDKPFDLISSADLKTLRETIAENEARVAGVIEGTEKRIVFSSESRPRRTKYSVLYIHGYSASRREISPVPENIAQSLHANLFSTRLTGHGIDGETLAQSKPNDWLYDTAEAWQVARALGEKVIVISTSTGGTLSTWLAQQEDVKPHLAAMVMVSPNYQPYHWAAPMFVWPWARVWMPLVSGDTHGWVPSSDDGEKYWTYRYPITAIHGLTALVKAVSASRVESIEVPTLFLYSDFDKVVKARATDDIVRRWGAPIKHRIAVPAKPNDNNHVVTGDIVRPETTEQFTSEILVFLKHHMASASE
jgi:esterase/lipase